MIDWGNVRNTGGPRVVVPPAPRLVESCWRLRFGKRLVACGIYEDGAPGVEVRAGFSEDDLQRTQRVTEISAARELAAAWRAEVVAKGGIDDGPSLA